MMSRLAGCDARRVLVVKPSALGDVVQALPLLGALKARFPRASLGWVIASNLAPLIEHHPDLARLHRFDRRGGWRAQRDLLRELRAARYDLVLDLQGLARTGVMTAATAAPLRVGLETAREGSSLACHRLLADSGPQVPAHIRYWRVAEELGVGHLRRTARVPVTAADAAWATHTLAPLRGPLLAVCPGARWGTKRWPAEKFAVLACKAHRRYGFTPVIVGAPDEAELCARVHRIVRRSIPAAGAVDLAGRTTLRQLAAVLSAAHLCVSNDTGPMHLAAAVGTPVVGVFTCTDAVRSGPPGAAHELVSTEVDCAASYRKKCPHTGAGHEACLIELDAARVWQALRRAVARHGRRAEPRPAERRVPLRRAA